MKNVADGGSDRCDAVVASGASLLATAGALGVVPINATGRTNAREPKNARFFMPLALRRGTKARTRPSALSLEALAIKP